MTTTRGSEEDGGEPGLPPPREREARVAQAVLAALGRPPDLYRVTVAALWDDCFRVNVVTGPDPSAVRIPHSFFVRAGPRGDVLDAAPPVRRAY